MPTINLTKVGGLIKVEIDEVIKGYYSATNTTIKLGVDGAGIEGITIGDTYAQVAAITDIEVDGVAVTNLADFEEKIATVFPNAGGAAETTQPKVYKALLTQSGTDAPVATSVIENTLGGVPVLTRTVQGEFRATLLEAFAGSRVVFKQDRVMKFNGNDAQFFMVVSNVTDDYVEFITIAVAGVIAEDGIGRG